MPQRVLLDTHVLLHWTGNSPSLSAAQRQVIEGATAEAPLYLADITFWEIATLYSLRRIRLSVPLREWLEQIAAPPLIERVRVSPAIAAEVAALPDSFHRDPADRLIVASARVMGATLLTQDRKIIEAGLVPTIG